MTDESYYEKQFKEQNLIRRIEFLEFKLEELSNKLEEEIQNLREESLRLGLPKRLKERSG